MLAKILLTLQVVVFRRIQSTQESDLITFTCELKSVCPTEAHAVTTPFRVDLACEIFLDIEAYRIAASHKEDKTYEVFFSILQANMTVGLIDLKRANIPHYALHGNRKRLEL